MTAPAISPAVRPDDLSEAGIRTVIVTSADVTGRLVGKRFPVDVFHRLMHEGVPLSSCVLGWDLDQWPGPAPGVHGPPHRLARRAARARPRHAASRRLARRDGDLRRRLPRDGRRGPRRGRAAHRAAPPGRTVRGRGAHAAGRERARVRPLPRHVRRRRGRTATRASCPTTLARADYTVQAGDQHEGFFSPREADARRVEPRSVDEPGGVGPRAVGDQPGVPAGARDGRPAHPVQARDARPRGVAGHGGDVHGEAVRRHDRLVVPPAPLARRSRAGRIRSGTARAARRSRAPLRAAVGGTARPRPRV